MDNRLTPFQFWCQKILPLVYDESLSYYEALCKFNEKLNEVIDWANGYSDELKAYVDEQITALRQEYRAEFAAYQVQINQQLTDMQTAIDNVLAEADAKIAANEAWVKAQILDLITQVNLQLAIMNQRIESNRMWNKEYTDIAIQKLIDELPILSQVMVRCPVNGQVMGIQKCLDIMYDQLRICGLTAQEYDSLEVPAEVYDAKGMTCIVYDLYARIILWPYMPWHKVYSGYTGELVSLQQGQYEIWQYLRDTGLTASAYDGLSLTAQAYDDKQTTGFAYDWTGVTA